MWPHPLVFPTLGWRVPPTVQDCTCGGSRTPNEGCTRLGGTCWIMSSATQVAIVASDPVSPCTTAHVPSFGRRSGALLFGTGSTYPWRGGRLEFFKALSPSRGTSRRPKRAAEPPGRVSLGKGGEVCPVGSCLGPGADDPTSRGPPGPWQGDTPKHLWPHGLGCCYVCGPTAAARLGLWISVGLSQALLSSRGSPGDSRRWWAVKTKNKKKVGR